MSIHLRDDGTFPICVSRPHASVVILVLILSLCDTLGLENWSEIESLNFRAAFDQVAKDLLRNPAVSKLPFSVAISGGFVRTIADAELCELWKARNGFLDALNL